MKDVEYSHFYRAASPPPVYRYDFKLPLAHECAFIDVYASRYHDERMGRD